jgi:hypothetical protein
MTSFRQIEANRTNALRSTGPTIAVQRPAMTNVSPLKSSRVRQVEAAKNRRAQIVNME